MEVTLHLIRDCALFAGLDQATQEAIARAGRKRALADGESLFLAGAPREALFIVLDGQVELVEEGTDGARQRLTVLGVGEEIGESALIRTSLHTTSTRALGAATVLVLPVDRLVTVLESDPHAAIEVTRRVALTMARRLQFAGTRAGGREQEYGSGEMRREHDLLGERDVPMDALYGVQTLRALENFPITGIRLSHFPTFVRGLAMVKLAAARANMALGVLDRTIGGAIVATCQEILDGRWHGHFVVDMVQGGAGTSTNMNANEVIANRALELLGHRRGEYEHCHPNNHVNLSQSTNDAYPTAIRISVVIALRSLTGALRGLRDELATRAREFSDVLKMGRTQLQDAVPMTLGQEFQAFADTTDEDIVRLERTARLFLEVNLGGTAIGTGINADRRYPQVVLEKLQDVTGLDLRLADNLVEATPDMGAFISFSGTLKRAAVKLSKMCNDLRLLSSGPRCGLNEIDLPAMQPGSSIMPGKVNPVIPEVVNQVAFQVIGNDLAVTIGAEAGQLQLNVMEPLIAFNVFQSIDMLTAAVRTLTTRCIRGIKANRDRCREMVEGSIGIVTAIVPAIGYERTSEVAKEALDTGASVRQIVLAKGYLTEEELDELMSPLAMTTPRAVRVGR